MNENLFRHWEGMISEGKKYAVVLQKDEAFPNGEECVLGNNSEWITLYFKYEIIKKTSLLSWFFCVFQEIQKLFFD